MFMAIELAPKISLKSNCSKEQTGIICWFLVSQSRLMIRTTLLQNPTRPFQSPAAEHFTGSEWQQSNQFHGMSPRAMTGGRERKTRTVNAFTAEIPSQIDHNCV